MNRLLGLGKETGTVCVLNENICRWTRVTFELEVDGRG